jgi:parallel beta-helix repeat protein
MKIFQIILIFFVLVLSNFLVVFGNHLTFNNIIYVNDDNIDGPWYGTNEHPFQFIQNAIDKASNGDTIFVYTGTYYENLLIEKKIKLNGENRKTTIINGNDNRDVIYVASDSVTISGFTIKNSGKSGRDSGIEIHSNYSIISDNIFSNNTIGIYLRDSSNNNLFENIIKNNKDYGIYLLSSINNLISTNLIHNNRWGCFLYRSSNNNIITANIISTNSHFGIWSSWSSNNKISLNIISGNEDWGIHLSGTFNFQISQNDITDNNIGLFISRCNGNMITKNNFQNNDQHASFMDGSNIWIENYWGRPRVFPKIIFDIYSSIFPKLDFDWKPAKKPYDNIHENISRKATKDFSTAKKIISKQTLELLPSIFSWRDINGTDYTTPVKNQVPSPTCEAYALCASLETLMQYEIGRIYTPDLSETHLYFYSGGTYRAGGVLVGDAAEYLINFGVPDEGCFPDPHRAYDYPFESLTDWENRTVKIKEWGWIENDIESIKHALINYGPLVICIVQRADFLSYKGGIYCPVRGQQIINGHVLTIVGYNDNERYWIIKNSGGDGWGEEGYARVSYDADKMIHPVIWPFYGGTGILYIDGLYGNFEPDVPKIYIENLKRHHTYIFGREYPTKFKNLKFVEKALPRIIGWSNVNINLTNGNGVKFYMDDELKHIDDESPFTWRFSAAFGTHTIYAVAYNDKHFSKDIVDIFILF